MKLIYKITADFIFLIHALIFFILLFGWMVPSIWHLYMATLIVTLLFDLFLGYCLLSKWEFSFRKKVNPEIKYDHTWATFYIRKITDNKLSPIFFMWSATIFLSFSLIINLYFRYFHNSAIIVL